jgi:hypothetical protein
MKKRRRKRRSSHEKPQALDARRRALDALNLMRSRGWSLKRSAREALTTPRTVSRYAASALRKTDSGRFAAKPFDRLARSLRFLTPDGQTTVTVRSSKMASRIAEYWTAVDRYLKTGNADKLKEFEGKSIRAGKSKLLFVTDLQTLDRIASAGEVSFEDIYAATA